MRRKSGPRIIEPVEDCLPETMSSDEAKLYDWFYGMVPRRDLVGIIGTETDCAEGFGSRMTKRDWREWARGESEDSLADLGYDRMEGLAEVFLPDPERLPIDVTYENDMTCLSIWDGHHRVALAVLAEMDEVPAYIGFPKDADD